ncbi:MAG: DUF6599 family protein [bacterium]
MRSPKATVYVALLIAAIMVGCAQQTRVVQPGPQETGNLAALFPTKSQIPGLLRPEEPKVVPPDGFPVYLGTRYPRYASYSLKAIMYVSYYDPNSVHGGPLVDMEVIRLGSSDDAYGVFSVERPVITEETQLRNHGYITQSKAGFWSEDLYVRILTPKEDRENTRWLTAVSEVVCRRFPPGPSLPSGFDRLPVALRVPHSEIFVRSRVIGYPFLTDGYLVDYDFGGRMATVFLCPCRDEEVAEQRFRSFFEAVVAKNAQTIPMSGLGDQAFLARRTRHGNIAVFRRGRFLAGLLAVPPVIGDFLEDFDNLLKNSP